MLRQSMLAKQITNNFNSKKIIKKPRKVNFFQKKVSFIDLFAGMGGIRIGFEQACYENKIQSKCVLSSEIKTHAINIYKKNFNNEDVLGDIAQINENDIPDFDYLLAGFPCQSFSSAGRRRGFKDERGSLFFEILRILRAKKPIGFFLENVDGLVKHNNGKTFKIIIKELKLLNYNVSYNIFNAVDFGIPQSRKRIYIVGHLEKNINLQNFSKRTAKVYDILEKDIAIPNNPFVSLLLKNYTKDELSGKSIKDKRGGKNNIHSWDIELKGTLVQEQKDLMNILLKKRRLKKWADLKKIAWMDGMPLTKKEISTFFNHPQLQNFLDDLVNKGYLKFEYPKNIFIENGMKIRKYDTTKPKGYNIVAGKLSFPLAKIINPQEASPTIVATEIGKLAVATDNGIRHFTVKEGLRLFGYPENYKLDGINYNKAFDLLGNTVMPPIVKEIMNRVLKE